ncbi:hypothetical protein [Brevibacterium samyangense]|uniref:Uncharacterized protein n=1 Tax=Brevibacterium samyangense TaxID=366888 RepID=A0ABN2TMB0_9MICO
MSENDPGPFHEEKPDMHEEKFKDRESSGNSTLDKVNDALAEAMGPSDTVPGEPGGYVEDYSEEELAKVAEDHGDRRVRTENGGHITIERAD